MTLKERCCAYALKVECDRCGGEVYFAETVEEEIAWMFEDPDLKDIEDFKACLDRICDYCNHVMDKDC